MEHPIVKRKITGFSCDDLKQAVFQTHGSKCPEYFLGAAVCQNIIAARANMDISSCKHMSGSRKSKILGNAFHNMQQKEKCMKSFSEFKNSLDELCSKSISKASGLREDQKVEPRAPWFKGKFHLAPELAIQAVSK